MKLNISPALAIAVALLLAPIARADEKALLPGDKAPEIKVSKWMQGNAIKSYKKGTVYVVEFWATWCGPCIKSIPHINQLSIKFKGKAEFVGVSIWEEKEDLENRTAKFMKDMGKDMTYRVAMDAADDFMATNWMEASFSNGIPTAFIINQEGLIAWIGHPMDMDEPLAQIVDKKFDLAASRAEYEKLVEKDQENNRELAKLGEAEKLYKDGKVSEALAILNELAAKDSQIAVDAKMKKLKLLASDNKVAATEFIQVLGKGEFNDHLALSIYSIENATEEGGNRDLALAAANAVVSNVKTDDPFLLYYCAPAFSTSKDHKKAIEVLERALKGFDSGPYATEADMKDFRGEIVKALEKEKAAIGKS